jgi:hypothetical protein
MTTASKYYPNPIRISSGLKTMMDIMRRIHVVLFGLKSFSEKLYDFCVVSVVVTTLTTRKNAQNNGSNAPYCGGKS